MSQQLLPLSELFLHGILSWRDQVQSSQLPSQPSESHPDSWPAQRLKRSMSEIGDLPTGSFSSRSESPPKRRRYETAEQRTAFMTPSYTSTIPPQILPAGQVAIDRGDVAPSPSGDLSLNRPTSSSRRTFTTTDSPSRATSPNKDKERAKRFRLLSTVPRIVRGVPPPVICASAFGAPTIDLQASNIALSQIPAHISGLIQRFSEATLSKGCIPNGTKSQVLSLSVGQEAIPEDTFGDTAMDQVGRLEFAAEAVRSSIQNVVESRDESAWYSLVQKVLEATQRPLAVEASYTHSVCRTLLPIDGDKYIPSVKVDFTVRISDNTLPDAKPVLASLDAHNRDISLSAFEDAPTSRQFTVALVEVKPIFGNYDEALYQLTVAAAAVQKRLLMLAGDGWNDPPPRVQHEYRLTLPVIGWVVHSSAWSLYICYRETAGNLRMLGPYRSGGTSTYLDVFRLLRIAEEVSEWVQYEYWEFLKDISAEACQ